MVLVIIMLFLSEVSSWPSGKSSSPRVQPAVEAVSDVKKTSQYSEIAIARTKSKAEAKRETQSRVSDLRAMFRSKEKNKSWESKESRMAKDQLAEKWRSLERANEHLCLLWQCDIDFGGVSSSDSQSAKEALKIAAGSKEAVRWYHRLRVQADIQKASPRLSTATKKQLDAQGIQHEGTVESVEGMKKLEQMRANNEFSKLLDWKARKDYYQKAHEQVASLFEKDGNDSWETLSPKQFETIINAMMQLPQVQRAIASEGQSPELKNLVAQYKQSPTHGEWIGFLILQKVLTPQGFVAHFRSEAFQAAFTGYQDKNSEDYRVVEFEQGINERSLTRNYVREYLLSSDKPMEKVAWIDLEKAVLSDNRLSFSQKRNLIANFYDGIFFSEAGYSPKEYLEAFQTRDDYEERDVGGIIQGQNKARKAASRSPIERLKLPPLLKKLPQGFLEQAQSTMEKGMSDLSVNDDQVGKLTKERFLEQTIGGLDEQAQQEVSAQLIASDPFYGQAFDNIQQRRAERGEEQLSISPQSTFTPVLDVSLSQWDVGKSITLPSGESATVIESEAGDLVLAIPDTSTGSLPMTLEAAENPEQRSRIEEEARRLGLIYFTPSEILLIQDTWNEAIERGGMNAPQAHIDMTDGIGLFERSSYLSFRRFLQQIQRRIWVPLNSWYDQLFAEHASEEQSATTHDEQMRASLLGYSSEEWFFQKDRLIEKIRRFWNQDKTAF